MRNCITTVMSVLCSFMMLVGMIPAPLMNDTDYSIPSSAHNEAVSSQAEDLITGSTGSTLGNYTYTGKHISFSSDFYDYLTNEEVLTSRGNITDSTSAGYTDTYTYFNTLISNDSADASIPQTAYLEDADAFQLTVKNKGGFINVYLAGASYECVAWPGLSISDGTSVTNDVLEYYNVTLNGDDIIIDFKLKDNSIENANVIFNEGSGKFQRPTYAESTYEDKTITITKGIRYTIDLYTAYNTSIKLPQPYCDVEYSNVKYINPLYFGSFYLDDLSDSYTSDVKRSMNSYANFWWCANTAPKEANSTAVRGIVDGSLNAEGNITQNGNVLPYFDSEWFKNNTVNFSAGDTPYIVGYKVDGGSVHPINKGGNNFKKGPEPFVQGKKYEEYINTNSNGYGGAWGTDYNDGTQTYFWMQYEKSGSNENTDVKLVLRDVYGGDHEYQMNYIATNSKGQTQWDCLIDYDALYDPLASETMYREVGTFFNDVDFPFYQIKLNKDASGKTYSEGSEPVYYQFNSEDSVSLYLNEATGKLEEHSTPIYSYGSHNTKRGFFPYNTQASDNGKLNNLGFGVKFSMDFTLTEDGMYNDDIPVTFEFKGDDDVWVFVDGKLALDLGGSHGASYGKLDFSTLKATLEKSYYLGNEDSEKDNLSKTVDENYTSDFELAEGSKTGDVYNSQKVHTLTMFYMERGMFDSNLFVRFNFAKNNYMTVNNQIDVSSVSDGLKARTFEAANLDGFNYFIGSNGNEKNGKESELYGGNGLVYPSGQTGVRIAKDSAGNSIPQTQTRIGGSTASPVEGNFQTARGDDPNTIGAVGNTLFERGDSFLTLDTTENTEKLSGITDENGVFSLLYGQSAKFMRQFTSDSYLMVRQNNTLSTLGDLSNASELEDKLNDSGGRLVSDYYTTSWTLSDDYFEESDAEKVINSGDSAGATDISNGISVTDGIVKDAFVYDSKRNTDTNQFISGNVALTASFVNTVKSGSLKIQKVISSEKDKYTGKFNINLKLSNIFGQNGVNPVSGDYITYTVSGTSNIKTAYCKNGSFTISLAKGETATVTGIPVGTNFEVTEDEYADYNVKGITVTDGNGNTLAEAKVEAEVSNIAKVENERKTGSILMSVALKNFDGNDITDGEYMNYEFTYTMVLSSENYELDASDGWEYVTGDSGPVKKSFTVTAAHPEQVLKIPYGTSYEVTVSPTTKWENITGSDKLGGTLNSSSADVTFVNQLRDLPAIDKWVVKSGADVKSASFSGTDTIMWKTSLSIPSDIEKYEKFSVTESFDERLIVPANKNDIFVCDSSGNKLPDIVVNNHGTISGSGTENPTYITLVHDFDIGSLTAYAGRDIHIIYNSVINTEYADISGNELWGQNIPSGASVTYAVKDAEEQTVAIPQNKDGVNGGRPVANTGALTVYKHDEDGQPLGNAEFKLFRTEADAIAATNSITPLGTDGAVKSDGSGLIQLKGLEYGDYWLAEVKAPEGYKLNKTPVKVSVNAGTYYPDYSDSIAYRIENIKKTKLPRTGGIGITIFAAAGTILVMTAFFIGLRKQNEYQKH